MLRPATLQEIQCYVLAPHCNHPTVGTLACNVCLDYEAPNWTPSLFGDKRYWPEIRLTKPLYTLAHGSSSPAYYLYGEEMVVWTLDYNNQWEILDWVRSLK